MHRILLLAALAGTAAWGQSPSISAIQNNYSYAIPGTPNYGIAPGSLFIVTGSNLANAQNGLQQFPLPTSLAGVSVSVTVNGTAVQAPIYYAYPTQLAAVLPSTTPAGSGTLKVTNNGASASTQIQVAASAFGILTLNGQGSGPAAAFDGNNKLLSTTNPAAAGSFITLWGSGVGADPANTNESVYPQKQDNLTNIPIEVDIGGVAGNVTYRGRSQFPGVDQIDVQIPAGAPGGCYVSVVVRSGSIASNFATIPVSNGGSMCTDAVTGFALSNMENTNSNPSAPPVALLNASELQALNSTGPTKVGVVMFEQDNAPAVPNLLGFITPTENVGEADFFNYAPGDFAASFSPLLISMGSCVVTPASRANPTGLNPGSISVGPAGSPGLTTLNPEHTGQFLAGVPLVNSYVFTGSGGSDVGAFSATVNVPSPALVWNEMKTLQSVNRASGVTVTWSGGAPNTAVVISGESAATLGSFDISQWFYCLAPVSAQKFTVPASVLLSLPATPTSPITSTAYLAVSNSSVPIPFSATGLDFSFAAATILNWTGLGTGFYYY